MTGHTNDADGALRAAVAQVLKLAAQSVDRLPQERADAETERSVATRHYRLGLVDGLQEATKHLLAPLIAWAEQAQRPIEPPQPAPATTPTEAHV